RLKNPRREGTDRGVVERHAVDDVHRADAHTNVRADRPTNREVIDHVGHDRVRLALPGEVPAAADSGPEFIGGVHRRQPVSTVAVFFLEAPGAPLIAETATDIEAAIEICIDGSPRYRESGTTGAGDDPAVCLIRLVRERRPPALGADIESTR